MRLCYVLIACVFVSQAVEEESKLYTVKLIKYVDSSKIKLIKEVKSLVEGMNLVQVKFTSRIYIVRILLFCTLTACGLLIENCNCHIPRLNYLCNVKCYNKTSLLCHCYSSLHRDNSVQI